MIYHDISKIEIENLSGRVAIKLHMGEKGNKTHISPNDVVVVFEKLKKSGCSPFLTDTTALYPGSRYTVSDYVKTSKENGFGKFPVVICRDDDFVERDGFQIPRPIAEADSLLVLSHGKGHGTTAFGGALKNMGMGCVNKAGKNKIHLPTGPVRDPSKCTYCGRCQKACFCYAIKVSKPDTFAYEKDKCCGCEFCIRACPSGALSIKPNGLEESFVLFARAASAVSDIFKGRMFCITSLNNITEHCDCCSNPGPIVCPDIGYLAGKNPLEVDREAMGLIRKKCPESLDFEKWNLFEKAASKYF